MGKIERLRVITIDGDNYMILDKAIRDIEPISDGYIIFYEDHTRLELKKTDKI